MKIGTAPAGGVGVGGLALAGIVAFAAACASGGGAPPVTATEADALFADLSGAWVLDEYSSARLLPIPGLTGRRDQSEAFRWKPKTLALRVDGLQLVYRPSPEETVEVSMNGKATYRNSRWGRIRTRVSWDEGRLGLEHAGIPSTRLRSMRRSWKRGSVFGLGRRPAGSWYTGRRGRLSLRNNVSTPRQVPGMRLRVREVLEVVDGRLEVTRTTRRFGETTDSLVLVYDRDEGGVPPTARNTPPRPSPPPGE